MATKLNVRVSGFKDYIAIYETIEKRDKDILYICEGQVLQLHCALRGSEKRHPQINFEDFYDTFLLMMFGGKLYIMMSFKDECGVYVPAFYGNSNWGEISPNELLEFGFTLVKENPQSAEYYLLNYPKNFIN